MWAIIFTAAKKCFFFAEQVDYVSWMILIKSQCQQFFWYLSEIFQESEIIAVVQVTKKENKQTKKQSNKKKKKF